MPTNYQFKKKKVAVIGLQMEGNDLVKFLLSKGANVVVYDLKEKKDLNTQGIDTKKVNFKCGNNYLKGGFKGFEYVFRSPGVYRYIPELVEAEKSGVRYKR
jgi:UDP-N-acetylmuramoylalanine-D-glutamate ligase